MTAGHNALRRSGPGQNLAFEMHWHEWVVLIAGATGSALRAVRPPNLHITRGLGAISTTPPRVQRVACSVTFRHHGPRHPPICRLDAKRFGPCLSWTAPAAGESDCQQNDSSVPKVTTAPPGDALGSNAVESVLSGLHARLFLLEQLVGGGDKADVRIGAAVIAEFLGVGEVFVEVDDWRIVVFSVIAVDPREKDVDCIFVEAQELLASDRREVPLLGVGGRGERKRGDKKGSTAEQHGMILFAVDPRGPHYTMAEIGRQRTEQEAA